MNTPSRIHLWAALLPALLLGCPSATPVCGDGTPDGEALCPPLCGNGKVEGNEACDDGNAFPGDGCEPDCTLTPVPVCGDGVKQGSEECDDGNQVAGDGCEPDCTATPAGTCGNGVVEPGEACDDGNDVPFDGCESDCTLSTVSVEQCPGAAIPAPDGAACNVVTGDGWRLITGDVLAPGKVLVGGQVLFDAQGIIQCVGCDCASAAGAAGATRVICPGAVVSPGLINPHDHITFHAPPFVPNTDEKYEHRHDWRTGNDDHSRVSSGASGNTSAIQWNELRQVMAGTTAVAGSGGISGLLRNLDKTSTAPNRTEGLTAATATYDTFPLGDSSGIELVDRCSYPSLTGTNPPGSPANGGAWLPHISEGIEASARNEFLCLSGVGTGSVDAVDSKTAIIHGIGVRAGDVARMAALETSLVWSPRSNVFLYGDTAPIGTYKRFGVNIALGTDWVRSGSMNILRELRCADDLNRTVFGRLLRDDELWMMVTANAAKALRFDAQIGSLEPGKVADISIFKGTAASPFRVIIEARPQDVVLTVRGGKVLFGEQPLVAALTADGCETFEMCGAQRTVCVFSELGKTFGALTAEVDALAANSRYPLFFCEEPHNEPTCIPSRSERWASPVNGTAYTGIPTEGDRDGDGIPDHLDNCPDLFNPVRPLDNGQQADADGDGIGDVCDVCPLDAHTTTCSTIQPGDSDGDGIPDHLDNCPNDPNPDQADSDMDGIGDACDWCPLPNPGNSACPTTVYEVKQGGYTGRPVLLGDVQVTAVRPSTGFFVQVSPDASHYAGADHSGLYVYTPSYAPQVQVGDRISVTGQIANFFGQLQLGNLTGLQVATRDHLPIPPQVVTPAEIATGGARAVALEAVLVRVEGVTVTELEPLPAGGESAPTWEYVVDGVLRVNDFLYRTSPFPTVGEQLGSISGVLNYRNSNSKLEPRSADDVVGGPATVVGFGPEGQFIREGMSGQSFPGPLVVTLSRPQTTDVPVTVGSSAPTDLEVLNGGVVIVPAGSTWAPVGLSALGQNASVTLTASLNGSQVTTTVRVLGLNEPAALAALTAASAGVAPGGTLSLTVGLDLPAPSDTVVALDIVPATGFGTVPATVTVLQDQQTASFTLAADPNAAGSATLTATLGTQTRSVEVLGAAECTPSRVVVSQLYGGGGNSGATYTHDFIELHNRSTGQVSIGGWSVQYTSAAGTSWSAKTDIPAGTVLAPGAYYLIQQAQGTGGTTALPAPDLIAATPIAMGATGGKVALVGNTTLLTGACPTGAQVIDFVGYGAATCAEGSPTVATSNTTGALRKADGCQDTDDNSADFTVEAPSPRNAASAAVACGCN
jgi:large repetitive protein